MKYILASFVLFLFTACTIKDIQKRTVIEEIKEKPLLEKLAPKKLIKDKPQIERFIKKEKIKIPTTQEKLFSFYKDWKGVKYKWGGNSKKGIDCSAFTQKLFKDRFNIKIPRTTLTQVKIGKVIKKSQVKAGDLVFFKTGLRDRHVGVYMGNGDFLHASIKGVKFTKLNKAYYKRKYWTARRVLNN